MGQFPTDGSRPADVVGDADDNDVVPARAKTLPASWVSVVSYWCDYLTIIDVQGLGNPAAQEAS